MLGTWTWVQPHLWEIRVFGPPPHQKPYLCKPGSGARRDSRACLRLCCMEVLPGVVSTPRRCVLVISFVAQLSCARGHLAVAGCVFAGCSAGPAIGAVGEREAAGACAGVCFMSTKRENTRGLRVDCSPALVLHFLLRGTHALACPGQRPPEVRDCSTLLHMC